MSPKEINIAIAEHLGWEKGLLQRECGKPDGRTPWGWTAPEWFNRLNSQWAIDFRNDTEGGIMDIPDFSGDLNAIQAAWESLTFPQKADFAVALNKLMDLETNICGWIRLIGATAIQRAEAFLRAINKWPAKS